MITASSVSLVALALNALAPPPLAQDSTERARKLFSTNCATCHGETGDGKGTTQLDRPARSFMDGGFSFGNTPEALFKTITTGIPGSPMAAFDSSLSEEERKLLASYVLTLGPPVEEVKSEDMILTVHDRPVVVRGKLPSLGEGLPAHPRGLLIGDPSGITFEYTVDDVRLLALRQGGFVRRTDWTGRGGTALEPLGKVVHLVGGGKPDGLFRLAGDKSPLAARLSGTRVHGGVEVEYHLVSGGREVAHVVERPSVLTMPFGTGFGRGFELKGAASHTRLAIADPTQGAGEELFATKLMTVSDSLFDKGCVFESVRKNADGGIEWRTVFLEGKEWPRKDGALVVDLEPGQALTIGFGTVPLSGWNDDVRKELEDLRKQLEGTSR